MHMQYSCYFLRTISHHRRHHSFDRDSGVLLHPRMVSYLVSTVFYDDHRPILIIFNLLNSSMAAQVNYEVDFRKNNGNSGIESAHYPVVAAEAEVYK